MATEAPMRLTIDCSTSAGLAATIPDILAQATEAARAGDADATAALLELAQSRAAEAALEPTAEALVPYSDDELQVHARDKEAAAVAASAALDDAWSAVRAKRDEWLLRTDWMFLDQLPTDLPASVLKEVSANKTAWTGFRQQLRDIVAKTTDPASVEWPVPPDAPSITLA